jgi:uncharacterized repeat protein (TIGR03806 family)
MRAWALLPLFGAFACAAEATDAGDPPDSGAQPADSGFDSGGRDAAVADAIPSDSGVWDPPGPVVIDTSTAAMPPATLSSFRFFYWEDGRFQYNERVVPYELNTPLFSDYSLKDRAIYVPEGSKIVYAPTAAFELPVGSAIIKSFSFAPDLRQPDVDRKIIETRVMIHYATGWRTYPYLWRADRSDADYFARGETITTTFIDPEGDTRTANYLVPQRNQCLSCHQLIDPIDGTYVTPIGIKARHLHRDHEYDGVTVNQLQHLADLGMLDGLPSLDQITAATDLRTISSTIGLTFPILEKAARDYLDTNCAHCHNPAGVQGITSRLYLNFDNTDLFNLGYCKEPGSAGSGAGGRRYDIVPGHPDDSILNFRLESERVGEMMPLIGRSVADNLGTRLVRGWVGALPPDDCQ